MDTLESADIARDAGELDRAEELYMKTIKTEIDSVDDTEHIRIVEAGILNLVKMYADHKYVAKIQSLLENLTQFLVNIPKAKTAKLIRKLFDVAQSAGMTLDQQRDTCRKLIDWSRTEKRTFLRHRLQFRLAIVQFEMSQYIDVLQGIASLLREVRRLDDKALLVEIHLLESRVHHKLSCISKARAAYVAAHTNANVIYCPPLLQADLDMQSGVLYLDEKDPKTAYSYFYEAFEGYHSLGDHHDDALRALKYMMLCKVATGTAQELSSIISSRNVMKYHSPVVEFMRELGEAYRKRDTQYFRTVTSKYENVLEEDPVVKTFLGDIYDVLLEEHLKKITEPYSVVQISHIASLLNLEAPFVESKLSQMILDKKLTAILDQKQDCLVMQEEHEDFSAAEDAFLTVEKISELVQVLYDKVNHNQAVESNDKDKR